MDIDIWLPFVGTVLGLFAVPGPTIMMIVALTLRFGRAGVPYLVLGVNLADFCFVALGLGGMAALLHAYPSLEWVLRLISLAYVAFLTVKLWRSDSSNLNAAQTQPAPSKPGFALTRHAFLTTITNPKGIVFVFGVFPTYMPGPDQSQAAAIAILTLTFLALSATVATTWGLLASTTFARLARWPHLGKLSAMIVALSVAWVWAKALDLLP